MKNFIKNYFFIRFYKKSIIKKKNTKKFKTRRQVISRLPVLWIKNIKEN